MIGNLNMRCLDYGYAVYDIDHQTYIKLVGVWHHKEIKNSDVPDFIKTKSSVYSMLIKLSEKNPSGNYEVHLIEQKLSRKDETKVFFSDQKIYKTISAYVNEKTGRPMSVNKQIIDFFNRSCRYIIVFTCTNTEYPLPFDFQNAVCKIIGNSISINDHAVLGTSNDYQFGIFTKLLMPFDSIVVKMFDKEDIL